MTNPFKQVTNGLFAIIGKYYNRVLGVFVHKNNDQFLKILLYLAIAFLRLPAIYVVPIQHALFNSHSVARYFILLIILCLGLDILFKKTVFKIKKLLGVLILLFFFSQSISIIAAVNINEFFLLYKHVLFSLLLFIVALYLLQSKQDILNVLKVFMYATIINLILEYILYYEPNIRPFLRILIYDREWDVIDVNLMRNRYFITIYDNALIPLYFYLAYTFKSKLNIILNIFLIIAISFFTYISNFRTHLLMTLIALSSSFYIYFHKKQKYLLLLLFLAFIAWQLMGMLSHGLPFSSLDRLIEPEEADYSTLSIRLDWWKQSVDIANYSPLIGVGLRNYYDYTDHTIGKSLFTWKNKLQMITLAHPHSIFFGTLAETGYLGLIALLILLIYFFIEDIGLFRKNDLLAQSLIASFWVLFSYSLLNPPDTLTYLALFWLLRALIYKLSILPLSKDKI